MASAPEDSDIQSFQKARKGEYCKEELTSKVSLKDRQGGLLPAGRGRSRRAFRAYFKHLLLGEQMPDRTGLQLGTPCFASPPLISAPCQAPLWPH